ncbi:hypothetical protein T439DRAFT_377339 [Meredithblackwellia eburnea MCA 4105]
MSSAYQTQSLPMLCPVRLEPCSVRLLNDDASLRITSSAAIAEIHWQKLASCIGPTLEGNKIPGVTYWTPSPSTRVPVCPPSPSPPRSLRQSFESTSSLSSSSSTLSPPRSPISAISVTSSSSSWTLVSSDDGNDPAVPPIPHKSPGRFLPFSRPLSSALSPSQLDFPLSAIIYPHHHHHHFMGKENYVQLDTGYGYEDEKALHDVEVPKQQSMGMVQDDEYVFIRGSVVGDALLQDQSRHSVNTQSESWGGAAKFFKFVRGSEWILEPPDLYPIFHTRVELYRLLLTKFDRRPPGQPTSQLLCLPPRLLLLITSHVPLSSLFSLLLVCKFLRGFVLTSLQPRFRDFAVETLRWAVVPTVTALDREGRENERRTRKKGQAGSEVATVDSPKHGDWLRYLQELHAPWISPLSSSLTPNASLKNSISRPRKKSFFNSPFPSATNPPSPSSSEELPVAGASRSRQRIYGICQQILELARVERGRRDYWDRLICGVEGEETRKISISSSLTTRSSWCEVSGDDETIAVQGYEEQNDERKPEWSMGRRTSGEKSCISLGALSATLVGDPFEDWESSQDSGGEKKWHKKVTPDHLDLERGIPSPTLTLCEEEFVAVTPRPRDTRFATANSNPLSAVRRSTSLPRQPKSILKNFNSRPPLPLPPPLAPAVNKNKPFPPTPPLRSSSLLANATPSKKKSSTSRNRPPHLDLRSGTTSTTTRLTPMIVTSPASPSPPPSPSPSLRTSSRSSTSLPTPFIYEPTAPLNLGRSRSVGSGVGEEVPSDSTSKRTTTTRGWMMRSFSFTGSRLGSGSSGGGGVLPRPKDSWTSNGDSSSPWHSPSHSPSRSAPPAPTSPALFPQTPRSSPSQYSVPVQASLTLTPTETGTSFTLSPVSPLSVRTTEGEGEGRQPVRRRRRLFEAVVFGGYNGGGGAGDGRTRERGSGRREMRVPVTLAS